MSRKRLISPEFFTHSALYDAEAASGLPLRVAFAGLWTASDRRGLFRWRPRELKLAVLPYDDADFTAVLEALEDAGFVRRYVVDCKEYGAIPSFAEWQHFHPNEKPSDLPEPPPISAEPTNGRPEPTNGRRSKPALTTALNTASPASWPADGAKLWTTLVGATSPGRVGKALSEIVTLHGWPVVRPDLAKWVAERKRAGRPCRIEYYASEASSRITAPPPPPLVDEHGSLTEYGERMTRPDKVPA